MDQTPQVENQKLQDLINGKFNDVDPERFLQILRTIVDEIGDIEPVKDCNCFAQIIR